MTEIARRNLGMIFRVLDREGRPIGEIRQPTVAPVVGRGAETVLLVRGDQVGEKRTCS
jgi:hypothetical protein